MSELLEMQLRTEAAKWRMRVESDRIRLEGAEEMVVHARQALQSSEKTWQSLDTAIKAIERQRGVA